MKLPRFLSSTRLAPRAVGALLVAICAGWTPGAGAQDSNQPLRALVTPSREAVISGEIEGRIISVEPGDGEAFKKDEILVKFDCTLPSSALAEARAELKAAQATMATKAKLDRLGSISGLEVELARAGVEKAEASVQAAQWRVRQCTIRAPYDGRVVKRLANAHEVATAGQKLIEIVSSQEPEVRVLVPSNWSAQIKSGDAFSVTLEETGRTYDARVIAMGARIDPASQSVEVRGVILKPDAAIVIGMSGTARFGVAN